MTLQPLAYDTPTYPKPTAWLHYIALACGLIPLGIGTVLFVLFLIFRTQDIALLGFITIMVGSSMAFVGFVCVGVYFFQSRRAAPDDAAVARRRVLVDLGIIIGNFPIAYGMAWAGLWLMARVTITVLNRDAVPAEQFRITTDYQVTHDLGTIAPNATKSITLSDDEFEDLHMSFVRDGAPHRETVSEYLVHEGKMTLSIKDGKLFDEDGMVVTPEDDPEGGGKQ